MTKETIRKIEKFPKWADKNWSDKFGNVKCKTCGKIQSPITSEFAAQKPSSIKKACLECCKHDALYFAEDWHGSDDCGGWEIEAQCPDCGKDDFPNETIIRDYKAVRRK